MLRRVWLSRHAISPGSAEPLLPDAPASSGLAGSRGSCADTGPSDAGTMGGVDVAGAVTRRNAMDEDAFVLGRTRTTCPRAATNPTRCARTRYGPGGSERSSNRPVRSVTANAELDPSAETTAPGTG